MLALAQKQYLNKKNQQANQELQIAKERFVDISGSIISCTLIIFRSIRLDDLRRRFAPTHTALLLTLSTIFPIELFSPPDLLFAILDVPLPIPRASNDPAPPLSMPTHKDITEDTVATALGYVAQLLQLVAAYLGKGLVYPVVCIGSKSLIKDNISAMVGPRM
jgi:UV radiation resistance-associated gene protein